MEVKLEDIQQRLSSLMGSYIVYLVDEKYQLTPIMVTKGISEMLGYTEEEFEAYLKDMPQSSFWGFDPAVVKMYLKEHLENGRYSSHTSQMVHKTQGYVWVHSRAKVLGEMNGQTVMLSELIQVEDAAKAVGLLAEQSDRIIYVFDADTYKLLYVNEKYLEWAKTTRKDALAHCCYEACIHSENIGRPCENCAPLQTYLEGGSKEVVSGEGQIYYHITTQKIQWGGHEAYFVALLDISEQRLAEKERLKQYYQHIDTSVAAISSSYLIFSANLTQNHVQLVHNTKGRPPVSMKNDYDDMVDWLCSRISREDSRENVRNTINRPQLLKQFGEGYLTFSVETIYSRAKEDDTYLRITVYMRQNPITKEVEATIQFEDVSSVYARDLLATYMIQHAYDSVGIIDMKYSAFALLINDRGEQGDIMENVPYDPFIKEVTERRVLEEEKELFLKNSSIETIRSKLAKEDEYSFLVHSKDQNGNITLGRFGYAYLNKYRETVIATVEDVTRDFEIDELTGLFKYKGFCIRAAEIIRKNADKNYAILYFNIKGFKAVNELFGNEAGDKVLQEFTRHLSNSLLKAALIGRIAVTDHFLCLVEEKNVIFNEIKNICHIHMILNERKISIHGRCGIYMIQDKNMSVDRMCDQAKLAKQHIRDEYAKPYAVFDEKMKEAYLSKTNAVSVVNHALENGEFCVYYQPIYDAKTGKLASAEALVRWMKPGVGMVSPGLFVPALEENGYISLVDRFMARSVRKFQQERMRKGAPTVPVSVNLSWIDFYDEITMNSVMEDISAMNDDLEMLRYEVTETSWAAMNSKSSTTLRNMREKGVKILLDDFGSGFSSFSTIRDYDFDILKIDMGFVQKLGMDQKVDGIICAIIEMAHHIHAGVVAEGVETEIQRRFLAENGCDYLQGYYFSKPIPEQEFVELLDNTREGEEC